MMNILKKSALFIVTTTLSMMLCASDDPFEDLLKNFKKELEAKPQTEQVAPKKIPAKIEETKPTEETPEFEQPLQKKSRPEPKKTKSRQAEFKSENPQEQEILTFVQTKLVPLADKLAKIIESPEVAKSIETARKNREAKEKAAASRSAAHKGSSKYRPSSSGSDRGWRDSSKGWKSPSWDHGDSDHAKFGSSRSPTTGFTAHPTSQDSKLEQKSNELTAAKTPTTKEESSGGFTSTAKSEDEKLKEERRKKQVENEDTVKKLKNKIQHLSQEIEAQLQEVLKLRGLTAPGAAGAAVPANEIQLFAQITILMQKFDDRKQQFDSLYEISDTEGASIESAIKTKESASWQKILANFTGAPPAGAPHTPAQAGEWVEGNIVDNANKTMRIELLAKIPPWLAEK